MLRTLASLKNPISDDKPGMAKDPLLLLHPFFFFFRRNFRLFGLGLLTLLLTNIFDALAPYLVGKAIDQIGQNASWQDLGHTVVLLFGAASALALFRYLWRVLWGRFSHGVAQDLRNSIFYKFLDLGPSYYQKNSVGQLISLITNDVNSFRMAIGPGTLVIADALFILLIVPPLMYSISPSWTLQTLVLMPLIPPLVARLLKVIYDNYRRQQDKFAAMSGISQEIISGIRVIKSYAQEFNQTRLFNVFNYQYEKASNQVAKSDAYFPPIMEFGVTIGSVILLTLGAPEVMDEKVTIGAFFAFYQYIQRMIWPMTALGIGFNNIQQGKASFGRIADLLMVPNDLPDSGPCEIDNFQSLKVENLSFAYPERPQLVLKDISFEIKAGETIGLIGETGSGKSTLIELLCRLYPVPEKTIFYNSIPIEELKKRSLSRLVSLVPQEAFLFSKPIQENIAFSQQEWSMDQIQTLSQLLNIDEEINQIPLKYEALLGERGVNLSGGQKQRLTIARALMASTPLIIFDDSLSAVDAKTERKILENFYRRNHQTTKKSTLLIVSHRIASLIQTDRTIVLKNGEVESIGSHRQLLLNSPTYRQLNLLQSESVTNDEL